jgi:CRISPR/Cas system-associated endonuclease Cas1
MGRTLYLNECRGLRVVRDGPSVWIRRLDRAGQRVPARLISRVVIIGNVKLDSGVITLFTDHDVPVVFMRYSGDETAVAIPYNHRLAKHYREQQVFLDGPEHTERYIAWADTKRMFIQVETLNRIFKRAAGKLRLGFGEGNYQMILSRLRPVDEEQWCVVAGIVNNLFRGMVIERLLKADLDPHLGVMHRRHNFGLALDICHIIGAESDIQAVQFFRCAGQKSFVRKKGDTWTVTDEVMRDIIQRFENRRETLENLVEIIIDELFDLMRELRT